jgi:hypothetical protein
VNHFSPSFVIPAKAGIHHLPFMLSLRWLMKPEVPGMDSRFRGNDEGFVIYERPLQCGDNG